MWRKVHAPAGRKAAQELQQHAQIATGCGAAQRGTRGKKHGREGRLLSLAICACYVCEWQKLPCQLSAVSTTCIAGVPQHSPLLNTHLASMWASPAGGSPQVWLQCLPGQGLQTGQVLSCQVQLTE